MGRLKNYYNIFATISLMLVCVVSYAQPDIDKLEENLKNASFKQKFETANSFMEDNLFEFALRIWLNLAKEEPNNANVNYKTGVCYLSTSLDRGKALPYLLKAEENVSKKYDPFSYAEKRAPLETHFYLGKAYHLNDKFDEAIEEYNLFQEEASKKHMLIADSKLHVIYATNAKKEFASKKNFQISNVGVPINSTFSEISPVVTADESAMFFTSRRFRSDSTNEGRFSPQDGKHFEDVYVSYKNMKTEKWGEPELMPFSSPGNNQATISVSADGQFLFIYKDDNGDGNIYISEREDLDYGRLRGMGSDINSKYWETHACISADGNTLYFVSDRPGGLGGRDIYRCVKLPNGKWSKALNIGAPINTEYDEDSPFFHPDGKTLFFSSNGITSMGGFDIFFTKKGEDGNWNAPLNIGYPLNTVDDDVFFSTTVDGKRGYYSSAHAGGLGETDIYTIELDTSVVEQVAILKGYIDAGVEKELPPGILIWVSDITEGGDPLQYRPNRRTGSYVFNLIPCHEYEVDYTKQGETFYQTEFKVPCNSDYHVIDKVISLGGIALNEGDTATTEPSDEIKEQWNYQIYIGDKPHKLDGIADIMNMEESEFSEAIKNGSFKYRELDSKKDPIFEIYMDDPNLCGELSIRLVDEKGEVSKVTTRDIRCKITTEKVVTEAVKEKWNYQVYIGDKPYPLDGFADIMNTENSEFSEAINKGSFQYRELKSKKDPIFEIYMDDPTLCGEISIRLVDEKGIVSKVTSMDIRCKLTSERVQPISFQKFYGYNEKGVKSEEERFNDFIAGVEKIIATKGIANIEIEGSASNVPTRTYGSNKKLATKRSSEAKEMLLSKLKEKGIPTSKLKLVAVNSIVSGPKYKGDYQNTEKYGKHQYIKMKAF